MKKLAKLSLEEVVYAMDQNNKRINDLLQENNTLSEVLTSKLFDDYVPITKAAKICGVKYCTIYEVVVHGKISKGGKIIKSNYGKNEHCRILVNVKSAKDYFGILEYS